MRFEILELEVLIVFIENIAQGVRLSGETMAVKTVARSGRFVSDRELEVLRSREWGDWITFTEGNKKSLQCWKA